MRTERTLIAVCFTTLGLCLLGIAYQVALVSQQGSAAQASLDRITTLVDHLIKLHERGRACPLKERDLGPLYR
jgi:hypothetical protein